MTDTKKSGTQAWVDHHYERGRVMAEEDFVALNGSRIGLGTRWKFKLPGDQMEKRSWLRTMKELIGAKDD